MMDAFAALVMAESELRHNRARAARTLGAHVGSDPVDTAMRRLLLDAHDPAVTTAAAQAVLARADAPGLRLFAAAWHHANHTTADHLRPAWDDALFMWSCGTRHDRHTLHGVLSDLATDADPAVATGAQTLLDQFVAAMPADDQVDPPAVAAPEQVQHLLDELCVHLGFCLPPAAQLRLRLRPSSDATAFADAVFAAEGMDPLLHQQVYDQMRAHIQHHLTQWSTTADTHTARPPT